MVPHKNSLRSTMNPRFVVVSVLSLPSAASLLNIRFQDSLTAATDLQLHCVAANCNDLASDQRLDSFGLL